MLGLCLKDREQLADARAAFERAIAHRPGVHPGARRAGRAASAAAAHARRNRAARRALRARSGQARAADRRRAGLSACRQSRSRRHRRSARAAETFHGLPRRVRGARPGVARCRRGTRRSERSAQRRSKRSSRSPRSRPPRSETLGLYGRALVLAGRHDEAESDLPAGRRSASQPIPRCCRISRRSRSASATWTTRGRRCVKYSVLVDDDRERCRARGADRRPVDAAERRDRGRRVVSEIGGAAHERRVAARADGRRAVRTRARLEDALATPRAGARKGSEPPARALRSRAGVKAAALGRAGRAGRRPGNRSRARREGQARTDRQMRRNQQKGRPPFIIEPHRRRRLNAESEKAERRLGEDRAGLPRVAWTVTGGIARKEWRRENARRPAPRARPPPRLALADRQHLGTYQASVARPSDHAQCEHDVRQARAQDGDGAIASSRPGKASRMSIDAADDVDDGRRSSRPARRPRGRERDIRRPHVQPQRHPRPGEDARQAVAAELIVAKRMPGRRRAAAPGVRGRIERHIHGARPRREQRSE